MNKLHIKSWSIQDRPREKLLQFGKQSLSDAELLAILLRSGTKGASALDLARNILESVNNNLQEFGKLDRKSLTKIKGIGEAKSVTLIAAVELGRRRQVVNLERRESIRSSQDAYNYIGPLISDLIHEEFWILLLNRNNQVFAKKQISTGGIAGTVVDPRLIFKYAIDKLASSLILVHNHPSGNLKPSIADKKITQKLKNAGSFLDISILDHLIISGKGYYSFADESIL